MHRFLLLLLCGLLSGCATPSSKVDHSVIITAAQKYLQANSASTVGDTTLKVEEVSGAHARVSVTPVKPTTDPALMYLRQDALGAWHGLTLGTGWSPDDFADLQIPESIRE